MEYLRCNCTHENGGRGRCACAQTGHPLKLLSPTKLARMAHFPPDSQAGCLAGPVFYVYVFSLANLFLCVLSACEYAVGYMTFIQCTISTVFRASLRYCSLSYRNILCCVSSFQKFFEERTKSIEVQGINILQTVKYGTWNVRTEH
jgi:hypothetical protein